MKKLVITSLITSIFTNVEVFAKDYGVHGHVFKIREEGFLIMIERKLQDLNLEEYQQKLQKIAKKRVNEPILVTGIKRTEKDRNFTYDPTYELAKDVFLPDGKLLYKAGTTVNPFDHMSLDKQLIFIDGRDKSQVEWFKQQRQKKLIKDEDKLVLVAGKPFELEQELNQDVYFDQAGTLISKFKITQVPAMVAQEDKILRIREVDIGH